MTGNAIATMTKIPMKVYSDNKVEFLALSISSQSHKTCLVFRMKFNTKTAQTTKELSIRDIQSRAVAGEKIDPNNVCAPPIKDTDA